MRVDYYNIWLQGTAKVDSTQKMVLMSDNYVTQHPVIDKNVVFKYMYTVYKLYEAHQQVLFQWNC